MIITSLICRNSTQEKILELWTPTTIQSKAKSLSKIVQINTLKTCNKLRITLAIIHNSINTSPRLV